MAPMAGVTDAVYRKILWEHGAGLTVSEMVSAKSLVMKNRNAKRLLINDASVRPWAVQFFSREPDTLATAIKMLEDVPFDIVNINMGCPMPKIVNNGEGAALMKDPVLVGQLVEAAVRASNRPVTVKIRKGFTPQTANAPLIAKVAQESGAVLVAVHGRTRDQYYTGLADWSIIEEVKHTVKIPVIGNGDINTPEDALMRLKSLDGVMIARGAMGNPWIFSRTLKYLETGELPPPPDNREVIDTAIDHLKKVEACDYIRIEEMRKHLSWYTKGMHSSADARRKINSATSAEEMESILRELC